MRNIRKRSQLRGGRAVGERKKLTFESMVRRTYDQMRCALVRRPPPAISKAELMKMAEVSLMKKTETQSWKSTKNLRRRMSEHMQFVRYDKTRQLL